MRISLTGAAVAVLAVVLLIVGYGSLFTVHQTRQAIVVRLGNPVRVVTEPGLNFKIPLIDSVIYIDNRILDLENPAQEVIASDQKRLVVDAFARYKITDALRFYQVVNTPERANSQLSTLLNSALRRDSSLSGRYGTTPPPACAPESRMILSAPPSTRSSVSR